MSTSAATLKSNISADLFTEHVDVQHGRDVTYTGHLSIISELIKLGDKKRIKESVLIFDLLQDLACTLGLLSVDNVFVDEIVVYFNSPFLQSE